MGYDAMTGVVTPDDDTPYSTGYGYAAAAEVTDAPEPEVDEAEPSEPEVEETEDDATEPTAEGDGADDRKLTPTEKRLAAAKALLAELESKAAEERREKARKAAEAEAARDKRLAASRGAALKQLYAAKGIDPIPGDRTEKERFAALLKALKVKV